MRNWPGTALLLGGMTAGRLAHETGLGSFVADVALVPVMARTRGRAGALAGAAVLVPLVAKRLLGNRRPDRATLSTYGARLMLDRDTWSADG